MIPRYSPQEFVELWSDKHKFNLWFKIETTACCVMQHAGLVPSGTLEAINTAVSDRNFEIDPYRISNIEQVTRHDVVAFLRHLEEGIGTPARWLHFGLTSSDVVDTAFAMTLLEACSLIDTRMENLISTLKARIIEHAHTPMVGRTHGQHAEPTTFGLVLAGHYQEVHRAKKRVLLACEDIVGTIPGAVGTYAHLSPELEDKILSSLGLKA